MVFVSIHGHVRPCEACGESFAVASALNTKVPLCHASPGPMVNIWVYLKSNLPQLLINYNEFHIILFTI